MKDVSMKELKNKATEMRMKVVDMISPKLSLDIRADHCQQQIL